MSQQPHIANPESVGQSDQTPIVQLPSALVDMLERTRCPECRQVNFTHARRCSQRAWVCDGCMHTVTADQIADLADGEHVICRRCKP